MGAQMTNQRATIVMPNWDDNRHFRSRCHAGTRFARYLPLGSSRTSGKRCLRRKADKESAEMASSGRFFGQVLLFIKSDRPDGPKIHTGSRVFVFSVRTMMSYRSGENCNAKPPKYQLPVGVVIYNF